MADMFSSGFRQLESTLIARERAQGVHSSNIANVDTPNYRADQRTFSDFMAEQQTGKNSGPVATTHGMHFKDINNAQPSSSGSLYHTEPSRRMDGNTVDLQEEMARMSETQLMHDLAMRLIKGKLSGLSNAIKEGR